MSVRTVLLSSLVFLSMPQLAAGQQRSESDYHRAEQFLGRNARAMTAGLSVQPEWLDGGRFWYANEAYGETEFILVDPASRSRTPAFDQDRLAAALSVAADTAYEGGQPPFDRFDYIPGGIAFTIADSLRWTCDLGDWTCTGPTVAPAAPRSETPSPDSTWVAFTRDHDVWVRSTADGQEIRLSQDGAEWYAYAENDQCCSQVTAPRLERERPPVLRWSPDSRRVVTLKLDRRGVEDLHLIETRQGRPQLHTYRYGLPGDSIIPTYDLHVFDVEAGSSTRIDVPPQPAVNTICCGLMADTAWKDVHWGPDGEHVYFTVGQRDFKRLTLMRADATSGETQTVLEERSPTFIETASARGGTPNWRVLDSGDVVWFSERDGWGHLYRIDGASGAVRNRITEGPWLVMSILRVDEPAGWVYFTAMGREPDRDPYLAHAYRAALDGSRIELLTPEEADHNVRMSPDGIYLVDTYSRLDLPPVTVVRDRSGQVLQTVEEADIGPLREAGWPLPTRFSVKGRDGVTDVHGVLFFPSDFDSTAAYPVVDYVYPGPQTGPIGSRSFTVNPRGNAQALAELGFVVFLVDAFGTPGRSKSFHDRYYGNMGDNGIPDHISALRQLATLHPQMDLDRVGIFGHSGGGFASTGAILRYPDFFKVAVSSAGNHDNRSYDYTWGEKYQGQLVQDGDGTENFDSQANHLLAGQLKGKLLLMYGTLDDNVHPNATLLVIDELIKANKDFDLIVLPNRNHGYANEDYVVRRTWDYFIEHLRGEEPPDQFGLGR
ncbi:MAG: prolyl oligopeptidase family serine peptidase [Gemmatimonadetes bacterium]|nr:prolyl oligopeptidase family serine peptidase [Gemmatimonadota bacterium]